MGLAGVVMCGGEGRRLRPLSFYIQKVMIPIGKRQKPLLEYIIRMLRYHGVTDILLLVGYKYEQILNYFEDGSRFQVNINYVQDPEGFKGTGASLLNAYRRGFLDEYDNIIIYYGDILSDVNLRDLINHHISSNSMATLVLADKYQVPVGVAKISGGSIVELWEKPFLDINVTIGILALNVGILDELNESYGDRPEVDIMGDLIPYMIKSGFKVSPYLHRGFWYDVGSVERFEKLDINLLEKIYEYIFR